MADEPMDVPAALTVPPKTPPPAALQTATRLVDSRSVTLDEAATTLMNFLPPTMVELIHALCAEHRVKPAAYVLSYCRLAYERGEVATHIAEGDVRRVDTGEPTALFDQSEQVCAYCHKPFIVVRVGQRFCLDPDDGTPGCGRRNTLDTMHAGREAYLERTRPGRALINRVAAPRPDGALG